MLNLGRVRPGSTIYIPFSTFDGGTGASITMTGLAVGDIQIYKDGGTTQRASTSGFTLLDTDGTDFDSITGIHGVSIDLADNTTAGFYTAGSKYWVVISTITVDGQTVSFIAATFELAYEGAILNTYIATLASQTSFTLAAGSADNSAYLYCPILIHDVASGIQIAQGFISGYTGSTKTVTLQVNPGIFTMAAGDNVSIFPRHDLGSVIGSLTNAGNLSTACSNWTATRGLAGTALPAAVAGAAGGIPVSAAGSLAMDTLADWVNGGRLDLILDTIAADVVNVDGSTIPTAGAIADAVWDESAAAHVGVGSFGEEVQTHALSSEIAALNDLSSADVTAAVPTVVQIADGVWDETLSGHLGAGSTGEALNAAGAAGDPWTTALPGAYGAGSAGNIIGNLNDLSAAEVNAEVDTALADYDAPTKAELDAGFAALNDPTAAVIADAVWDEAKAAHVGVGSFGEEVQAHALSTEISALNNLSSADVTAAVPTAVQIRTEIDSNSTQLTAILADTNELQLDDVPGLIAALNDPTAAAIADQVWEEAIIDHSGTIGSTAEALAGASAPSAADVADAVWDEAKAGHVTAGSFGEEMQAHALSTEISALNNISVADILDDASAIDGLTPRQVLGTLLAAMAGRVSGADTTSVTITNPDGTQTRISATVDANGNRSAITLAFTGL